ncbi:MAG: hypothetical protein AAF985_11400, partial [Bacteroidota bacterium]
MKNLLKLLGLSLVITIIFASCGKEELAPLSVANEKDGLAGVRDDNEPSDAKVGYIKEAIEVIRGMKDEIDGWKEGKKLQATKEPREATEMVEMVWNFFVSRPEFVYEHYETVTGTMKYAVEGDSKWNGSEVLGIYNGFKEVV